MRSALQPPSPRCITGWECSGWEPPSPRCITGREWFRRTVAPTVVSRACFCEVRVPCCITGLLAPPFPAAKSDTRGAENTIHWAGKAFCPSVLWSIASPPTPMCPRPEAVARSCYPARPLSITSPPPTLNPHLTKMCLFGSLDVRVQEDRAGGAALSCRPRNQHKIRAWVGLVRCSHFGSSISLCVSAMRRGQTEEGQAAKRVRRSASDDAPTASWGRLPIAPTASSKDPLNEQYIVKHKCVLGGGADGGVVRGQVKRGELAGHWHALKYISREAYDKKDSEKQVLMLLQSEPHRNIVALLDSFAPVPNIRAQWVLAFPEADMDCRVFLCRHKALSQAMATAMAEQVLQGVVHLHRHRVIHRDLKPDNILVHLEPLRLAASQGEAASSCELCLKIADFSRARRVEAVVPRRKLVGKQAEPWVRTMMSTGVCTVNYCAPETLWESQDGPSDEVVAEYGFPVDIWSFGCVCFEFHTGEQFAPGSSHIEVAANLHLRMGAWPDHMIQEHVNDDVVLAASASSVGVCPLLETDPWLRHALRWIASERMTANQLCRARGGADDTLVAASQGVTQQPPIVSPRPLCRKIQTMQCRCSGNCAHPRHRRGQSCPSNTVCAGTKFCEHCKCSISACTRPKHRSPYCYGHSRMLADMPWPLRATKQMGGEVACAALPVDVTDFVAHAAKVKTDLASVITLALIKEPAATAAFMESAQEIMATGTAEAVVGALMAMLSSVEQKASELEVLGAQGVARVTGLASTCREYFRIIAADKKSSPRHRGHRDHKLQGSPAPSQGVEPGIVLGKTRRGYSPTGNTLHVEKFLAACRSQQMAWEQVWHERDIAKVTDMVLAVTEQLHARARVFPKRQGYVRKFIDRKLVLLVLAAGSVDPAGWKHVEASKFLSFLPDQNEHTAGVPLDWSAADLSDFFFGREDWALFVSMWACFWGEVEEKYPDDLDQVDSFLVGDHFALAAAAAQERQGHNSTPCMVIDGLMKQPAPQDPR